MSDKKNATNYSNLVRTSRAGDAFHYRWAARFCLNMIKPKSLIKAITIEQSKESEQPGECVMDMTVYYEKGNDEFIEYYQMKHSEAHDDKHMTLGFLKNTIEGFSERYIYHKTDGTDRHTKFFVVTNKRIDQNLLNTVSNISDDEKVQVSIKSQLIRYTKLDDSDLKEFCKKLVLQGGEGNYEEQFYNITGDIGRLITGVDNTDIVNKLIKMIQDRALPNNRSDITKEIVLNQFGCSSEKKLYPAPSNFEKLENNVKRNEYVRLTNAIKEDEKPKIITATGGIGKSIFTSMLPELLGEEYLTIVYDCFGNGTYRNRLMFRHRHKEAMVQIVNELADRGFCEPLIPVNEDPDWLSESFQDRVANAVFRHKKLHPNGKLVIAIDAADNAEMVGEINQQLAFPSDLLHQGLPSGCVLVMLCRPEREHMLKAPLGVVALRMAPFSVTETQQYLASYVPDVSREIAEEVHRLTNGIPRVVSIAAQESNSIKEILQRLGPNPTTAEEQIEVLLNQAKNRITGQLSDRYLDEFNALCCGLAVLPPDIPICDLATIVKTSEDTIYSFVSEMGTQLMIVDGHLHFRDEPTEYWFQMTYSSDKAIIEQFITRIEPITEKSIYLAAALPELYVMAGAYEKMIDVVLKGQYLPDMNEADIREVEYTRLRFAVRAAINADRYGDLIGLGLMAGDRGEIHNRIYKLYQDHFDIVHKFLSKEPLRELAYKSKLRGNWLGSDKLYTAVLLSGTEDGKPEARVYLRSARQFLSVYFEEKKRGDQHYRQERLTNDDIFAFVLTTYNVFGIVDAINEIQSWSPKQLVFELAGKLTSYLIDINQIDEVLTFLDKVTDDAYCVLGIILELDKIGVVPDNEIIQRVASEADFDELDFSETYMLNEKEAAPMMAVATLCERFIVADKKDLCLKLVDFIQDRSNPSDFKSDFYNYKRAVALRAFVVSKRINTEMDFFSHEYFSDENSPQRSYQDKENVKGIFNTLFPWYVVRLEVILGECDNITKKVLECRRATGSPYEGQYGRFNTVEKERYTIVADIFLKNHWENEAEAAEFFGELIIKDRYGMPKDRVNLLRGMMRISSFDNLVHKLEKSIHETVINDYSEPYERVETLMQMVRSLLAYNHGDARTYFEESVNENEKFGEDLPNKWRAIASIARRVTSEYNDEHRLSYRFIRVAEFVGEHIVREKYWDRNDTVRIATLLSPTQGLAAISRWRERNVGLVEEQLKYVIEALIYQEKLTAQQIWGMSGFFPNDDYFVVDLAIEAMKRANDNEMLEIAKQVNRIAGVKGYNNKICRNLEETLSKLHDFNEPIYPGREDDIKDLQSSSNYKLIHNSKVEELLKDWHYNGRDSVRLALEYVKSTDGLSSSNDYYWTCLMQKVPLSKFDSFLSDTLSFPNEFWSVTRILTDIPTIWKERSSFPAFWNTFLKKVGRVYASEFLSTYYRRSLEERTNWSDHEWYQIYTGCVDAIKTNYNEFGPSDYYDLAVIGAMIEVPGKSFELLDVALKMLEKDINEGYADGTPEQGMLVAGTFDETFGSFFKTALASPDSEVRWMAVHCVVRYGLTGDSERLLSFVDNMTSTDTSAFLSKGFKLYDMNFQLYLLIALQRITLEQPRKLLGMKHFFTPYFDEGFTHGLIQLTVYRIMQLLKDYAHDFFSEAEMEAAERWFISSEQVIRTKNYYNKEKSDKYHHLFETSSKFHVAFDFDRYWLNALEMMFNIPVKHLERLIGNYVVETMGITVDSDGRVQDERQNVFRSHKYKMRAYPSQGELPSVERLSFYFSYHGMFAIAGRLLKEETLYTSDYEDDDNPYLVWLKKNYIRRKDGYLLLDGRTPTPVSTPVWAMNHMDESWLTKVDNMYLFQNIFVNKDICVSGCWEYQKNSYRETVMIDSILLRNDMVFSLLTTLKDIPPHDYYLGVSNRYDDNEDNLFHIERWITKGDSASDLDKHDPWAKGTRYPDYEIEESYMKKLNLQTNKLRNKWFQIDTGNLHAYTQNWVENFGQYNEDYYQPNSRILATEEMVKRLCVEFNKVLVINVKIDRQRIKDRYSSNDESDRFSFHAFKVIDSDGRWVDEC